MKRASVPLATIAWAGLLLATANAQPILNRVEQMLRKQLGAADASRPAAEPGYLGLVADDRPDGGRAVRIVDVTPDGPAARGGLKANDVLLSVGGKAVRTMDDLASALEGQVAGATLNFVVRRGSAELKQNVTLGKRPDASPSASEELPGPASPDANAGQGPRLGVRTLSVSEEARRANKLADSKGAMVVSVAPGTPAELAGIPLGAVITSVNGQPVGSPQELAAAVRKAGAGDIQLTYFHQVEQIQQTVSLGETPAKNEPPKLELKGPQAPQPAADENAGPALGTPPDRIGQLEAKVAELEARIKRLEAQLPPEPMQ